MFDDVHICSMVRGVLLGVFLHFAINIISSWAPFEITVRKSTVTLHHHWCLRYWSVVIVARQIENDLLIISLKTTPEEKSLVYVFRDVDKTNIFSMYQNIRCWSTYISIGKNYLPSWRYSLQLEKPTAFNFTHHTARYCLQSDWLIGMVIALVDCPYTNILYS